MVEKQAMFGLVQVGVILPALATAIIHIVLALPTNLIMTSTARGISD